MDRNPETKTTETLQKPKKIYRTLIKIKFLQNPKTKIVKPHSNCKLCITPYRNPKTKNDHATLRNTKEESVTSLSGALNEQWIQTSMCVFLYMCVYIYIYIHIYIYIYI